MGKCFSLHKGIIMHAIDKPFKRYGTNGFTTVGHFSLMKMAYAAG